MLKHILCCTNLKIWGEGMCSLLWVEIVYQNKPLRTSKKSLKICPDPNAKQF